MVSLDMSQNQNGISSQFSSQNSNQKVFLLNCFPARVPHQRGLSQPRLDVTRGDSSAPLRSVHAERQQREPGRRGRDLVPVRQEGLHACAEDRAGGLNGQATFSAAGFPRAFKVAPKVVLFGLVGQAFPSHIHDDNYGLKQVFVDLKL